MESFATVTPQVEQPLSRAAGGWAYAVGVSTVSFAGLLLELGLTRLFSVVLFYHFAFLAISVALLGLGAGGVFAYVRKPWLEQWTSRQLGQRLCAANAVVTLLVLVVVLHLQFSI